MVPFFNGKNKMKVKDLISKLSEFDSELPVTISDGYNIYYYNGEYQISYQNTEIPSVNIEIGEAREYPDATL